MVLDVAHSNTSKMMPSALATISGVRGSITSSPSLYGTLRVRIGITFAKLGNGEKRRDQVRNSLDVKRLTHIPYTDRSERR